MRIISKFRDFYDGVQRYGSDDQLIYVRDQVEGENPIVLEPDVASFVTRTAEEKLSVEHKGTSFTLRFTDLGLLFCGKFYPKFRAQAEVTGYSSIGTTKISIVGQVHAPNQREAEALLREKLKLPPRKNRFNQIVDLVPYGFNEVLARTNQMNWLKIHQEYSAPVLAFESKQTYNDGRYLRKTIVLRNPSLKESGFAAEKNAVETYQEISMYLGGVMVTYGRPMCELSDAERIAKQGFDEWSFRRLPTKVRK